MVRLLKEGVMEEEMGPPKVITGKEEAFKNDVKRALDMVACLGRDAYGSYIDRMAEHITQQAKVHKVGG
jgi:hypothetical protein